MALRSDTTMAQPFATSDYKLASVVGVDVCINTTVASPPSRTVVTTINTGTITLRYAPREQPPLTDTTSG
jgi:hypothetical protein